MGFTLGVSIGLIISWFIKKGGLAEGLKEIGDFSKSGFGGAISFVGGSTVRLAGIAAGFIGEALSNGDTVSNTSNFTSESGLGTSSTNNISNNQAGNISIVNNITVADKSEFEKMIQTSNNNIIREVRRNATV